MASGTLSLTRRWGGVLYPGPFPVVVDDRMVGRIPAQETMELSVETGEHTLRLGSGRHRSPTRGFEVAEGELVEYWCRGSMLWLPALFKPDLWITLRRV